MLEMVPIAEAKEETLRLLEEYSVASDGPLRAWLDVALPSLQNEVKQGRREGGLWVGPKDEGIGFAFWDTAPHLGARVWHGYLAEGYRSRAAFAQFLQLVERSLPPGRGPLIIVPAVIPGTPGAVIAEVLRPRGFFEVVRPAMLRSTADPPEAPPPRIPGRPRAIRPEDREAVAELSAAAFADGVSRLWFRDGDLLADAQDFLRQLEGGEYGPWLQAASGLFESEEGGHVLGASLVSHPSGRPPLLLSLMVHPRAQSYGIGRALLAGSLRSLHDQGIGELELNVVAENASAFHLYRSVGFQVVPGSELPFWVRDPLSIRSVLTR